MAFKFGRQQIGKPTPASVGFKILVISIVAPIIQVWMGTASYIPNNISNIIISILALTIAVSNALKPLFGVDVPEKNVPSKDVKEVEDKPIT
jgi:hypothetical protein